MRKMQSILIVDDSEEIVMILAEEIEAAYPGIFKILTCGKVSEAVMKLKNQKFDLVILDLQLKQGDGESILTLVKEGRAHPNRETPFVIITGSPYRIDDDILKTKSVAAFAKPFDPKLLIDKIGKVLRVS